MTKESIISKVKKLMAIAENDASSDGEIDNAMRFAQQLMDNHHLTEEDLAHEPDDDYAKVDKADKGERRAFVGRQLYTWESMLAGFASKFVGCPCYVDNNLKTARKPNGFAVLDENGDVKKGKSIVFYGIAEDAMIAVEIYNELRALIATMAVGKWGGCYRGDGAAYSEGFVSGLNTKLAKARIEDKKSESTSMILLSHRRDALIKYKNEKAQQWLSKERGIKLRSGGSRTGSSGSYEARRDGRKDGAATDVSANRSKKLS